MPFEMLQVTAAYSNAVLVAIMPHISDFAKTLDLPIPRPITVAQVRKFGCSPLADHVGGRVVLTNDYSFTFDLGAVVLYRSPRSFYSLQEPERIPEFFGRIKIGKEEAVKRARDVLKKLGYTEAALHFDSTPTVTPPPVSEGKQVARYLIQWPGGNPAWPSPMSGARAKVEVDASSGQIQMLSLNSRDPRRPDPVIGVHPPVLSPPPQSEPVGGTKLEPVSKEYAHALLLAILPTFSEFVKKAGADVRTPITINDLDMAHYEYGLEGKDPLASIYLKTGERFVYSHGQVVAFETRDSYRRPEPGEFPRDKPVQQFYGPVNMSSSDALAMARKVVNQLGYPAQIPQLRGDPKIVPPRREGTNYFARYFFNWWRDTGETQIAVLEVDATTKKLKAFSIDDRANPQIWRAAPKINVPTTSSVSAPAKAPETKARVETPPPFDSRMGLLPTTKPKSSPPPADLHQK